MSDAVPATKPTKVRWLIVLLLMGFTLLAHFNRTSISVAGSERFTQLGISPENLGWIYSAFLIAYTICMLPSGWVIDRIGPKRAMLLMGWGMGICTMATGCLGWVDVPFASLFFPLILIRVIAGISSTPLHPGAARSISLWHPMSSMSTANGLVTAGALIGISFSYPAFGWVMDRHGWQTAFVLFGGTLFLFTFIWYFLASDDVGGHLWVNQAEKELVESKGKIPPRTTATISEFFGLFLNRQLVLLSLSYAALSYFQYLFFYWIGHYFEKELGLPPTESRNATFTVSIAMAVGMALGGICTDFLCRMLGRRWGCRLLTMSSLALSALFAWCGMLVNEPNQIIWLFSFALGTLGLCEGVFWTTAPLLEPRRGGLACAFLNTVGNAGGLLAPIFTPWIGTHYGWNSAIAVACIVSGTGAIFWLWIDSDRRSNSD